MGNKKVDMVEVHAFSDDLQQIALDMHSQLEKVIKSIDTIQGMDSFSGKAAKDAKRYFHELHVTVLTAFQGLFEDLEENLRQHISTFESEVDDSESAIVTSHYLEEVREDIEETFEKLTSEDETIHDIISEVSDLTSATSPDFSDVNEWKKKAVKETKELEADIHSFTSTGNETDVQAIMQQIETVMNKAKGSTGKASFEGFEGISSIDALRKLTDYNEEKENERNKEIEEAKDIRDSALQAQNKPSSREIIKMAFDDYRKGEIGYEQYVAIIGQVEQTNSNMNKGRLEEQTIANFLDYLDKNGMLDDYVADNSENISMLEIDKMHEKKLEQLNVDDQDRTILNQILQAYKSGNIDQKKYFSLMGKYSEDNGFSEETYADLQALGLTVLSTNNMGIAEGINYYAKESKAAVDKVARGFSGLFKGGTYILGTGYGMYDDIYNNDKTVGEAVAHNGASLGVGVLTGFAVTGLTSAILGVSMIAAAPVVAGLVAGAIVGFGFEVMYNRDLGDVQKTLDKAGEAISSGLNKLNPMNWG
ncbi:T7SS effector LXG polymorphic toxin [Pseudogracilibacillus sp. ICA-222130]|uniref:T7SS effector LXG polymorphic toxin n=1 Tax=Pseudogracilibacillus sp. ICA-222130 TaxID=3134655 RepID=UPI0030BB5B5E